MSRGVGDRWRSTNCSAGELLEALSQGWLELDTTGVVTSTVLEIERVKVKYGTLEHE